MKKTSVNGAALAAAAALSASAAAGPAYPLQAGDPLVKQQWHLQNTGQDAFSKRGGIAGYDLNLAFTHLRGIRGVGTTIAVIDGGVEIRHPDLAANVVPGSKNFDNGSGDPTPDKPEDNHGTAVAGIAAAVGWNGIGGRGVAPSASLQGFNWIHTQTLDDWLLSHGKKPGGRPLEAFTDARVFNQSYGVSAPYSLSGNPDTDIRLKVHEETYEDVSRNSHWGRGAVFVKSAGNNYKSFKIKSGYIYGYRGNNGLPLQDANIDPENSNYWNVVVAAINADGVRSSYSSAGSNVLLSAPGGEYGTDTPAIVTTDLSGCNRGWNISGDTENRLHGGNAQDPNCDYTGVMNGTSSAAPAASGAFALVMSANPALSARDVRHILLTTARQIDAANPGVTLEFKDPAGVAHRYQAIPGWQKNAAGLAFHSFYGFGLIDVDKAVEKALFYNKPLPPLQKTRWETISVQAAIPDADEKGVESTYVQQDNLTVEAVQVLVDAEHGRASDLAVELISPSGTRSILLAPRTGLVKEEYGLDQQRLLSNQFYGEAAKGQWRLRVLDTNSGDYQYYSVSDNKATLITLPNATGKLKSWSIRFFGHRS
ncbi:S8 family serine peptidase [Chromobacterium sp. IIBBL 290-4]|uniref:S8 family serine peptidase n=1 Tax=Chromobacterium sp. IIBBL 290-4 TaxID=2953890 RepID=UPI0020B89A95|nr:S8 family serine peptidase [Chromobacterium sp. IIBBL 290-4]UTH74026.1 S8 family serine peptidase [Chromobacterium sp. IIBBL 290-4]